MTPCKRTFESIALAKSPFKQIIGFLLLILFVMIPKSAHATYVYTANFEDFTNGTSATSLTDGGITFTNLFSDPSTSGVPFYVDSTSDTNFGFSLPNYLTFGASGFGVFYSMDILFPGTATNASLNIGAPGDPYESNSITLEALQIIDGDTNIMTTSTWVGYSTNSFNDVATLLSVNSAAGFNALKLIVNLNDTNNLSPDFGNTYLCFGLDNVVIKDVPEPTTYSFLFITLIGIAILRFCLRAESPTAVAARVKSSDGRDRVE